jgi:prepilin-type N-terminal cleavage/methylation domain-containing protein/prepilin-type processing-associated H-X9-DG protein
MIFTFDQDNASKLHKGKMVPPFAKRNSAFTLIELLVVIAIISLLVTILMPSLQKAKMLARGAVCRANLSGIGKAIYYYTDECDGTLPVWEQWDDPSAGTSITWWYMDLAKMMGWPRSWTKFPPKNADIADEWEDPGIFLCPMTDRSEVGQGKHAGASGWRTIGGNIPMCPAEPRPAGSWWLEHLSYGWNIWMGNYDKSNRWKSKSAKIADVLMPYQKVLVGDSNNTLARDSQISGRWGDPVFDPALGKRHNGGAFIVWCDGHVDWGDPYDLHRAFLLSTKFLPWTDKEGIPFMQKYWFPGMKEL